MKEQVTVGAYLATRLEQAGLKEYFAVPGDYNLTLLDELIKNKNLKMINCCNELNGGYAADGYARSTGLSALVVTFTVGGLSALNAVAGAYSEDLPMILISGGPNSNSAAEHQILHHTIGLYEFEYMRDMCSHITVCSEIVKHLDQAPIQIDRAIQLSLMLKKPVYIEIACNISNLLISAPNEFAFQTEIPSNPKALDAAVTHAASLLNAAERPVMVAGPQLRSWGAFPGFLKCADASGYGVATMSDAKGCFPETHSSYMGIYWGPVSSPGCGEIVDSADYYLFAGAVFNDYSTSGYTSMVNSKKMIHACPNHVSMEGQVYSQVGLNDFLMALSKKLKKNTTSLDGYKRIAGKAEHPPAKESDPITVRRIVANIEKMLTNDSIVVVETGDSWFNGLNLKLPEKARFESQMRFGSIGWSVGAVLGLALGAKDKKVIGMIGDGAFQMSAQEVSTMIRYEINATIFLMNNRGYTIEVEIHDGPYNKIKNWHYKDLVTVFSAGEGKAWSTEVKTEGELKKAIEKANQFKGLSFIEVHLDSHDCNKTLLKWGGLVATNNARKPRIG